jgi:hypothetical protein
VNLSELERAAEILGAEDPRIAPAGEMMNFVGPQLSEELIEQAYARRNDDDTVRLAPRVRRSIRSFPVMALRGVEVRCEPRQFGPRLRDQLTERLPGTSWSKWPFERSPEQGLVEKYHILDGTYPAPMDNATKQSMVIELGGDVEGLDGPLDYGDPFPDQVIVKITHAHWANVSGLAIGVGFYM